MIKFLIDNLASIFLATLAAMVVGGIWYAKPVFGASWQKLSKVKASDMKGSAVTKAYVIMFVMAFITAIVLKRFLVISDPQTLFEAIKVSIWIWLGFIAAYTIGGGVFAKTPAKLIAINLGNQLVTLATMTAILYYI